MIKKKKKNLPHKLNKLRESKSVFADSHSTDFVL